MAMSCYIFLAKLPNTNNQPKCFKHTFKTNGFLHNLKTALHKDTSVVFQKKWRVFGGDIFVIILKFVPKSGLYQGRVRWYIKPLTSATFANPKFVTCLSILPILFYFFFAFCFIYLFIYFSSIYFTSQYIFIFPQHSILYIFLLVLMCF